MPGGRRRSPLGVLASLAVHAAAVWYVVTRVALPLTEAPRRETPPPIVFLEPPPPSGGGGGTPYIPPPEAPPPEPKPARTVPAEVPKEIPPATSEPEPSPAPSAGGEGAGTGGGTGTGTGTGTGAGTGPGAGEGPGGEGLITPPVWIAGALPLETPPEELRGRTLQVTFHVGSNGRVERAETEPRIGDGGYAARFQEVLRTFRFKPARKTDGTPVAATIVIAFQLKTR